MLEKYYKEIPSQFFTATGTAGGVVTIFSTVSFKLNQLVVILNPSLPSVAGEIKAIFSDTQMAIGPQSSNPNMRIDLSAYGTTSTISAPEQQRPTIATQDIERYTYEEAPIVARRIIPVDDTGNVLKFVRSAPGEAKSLAVSVDGLTFNQFSEAKVSDALQGTAQGAALQVGAVPVEAKGGATVLLNRKGVFITPTDKNLYMGFANTVSAANGIPIFINQMVYVPASAAMRIWLVNGSGGGGFADVRIWEVG
jgi:hypothetical protein